MKPLSTFFTLLCCLLVYQAQSQTRNIVLIIADDQGWTGTSVQMDTTRPESISDYYYTPNLEQLAQDGMTFSQAYSPAAKCSPTRNSILTGQTTAKSQFTTTTTNVDSTRILLEPSSIKSIEDSLVTFPELLKQYNPNIMTAHYGKWHLGSGGPASHGFDRGDGNTGNNEGDQGGLSQADPKRIFEITDSAITFMTDAVNAGRPFYVQLSHYAVHTPTEAQQMTLDLYSDSTQRPMGTTHTDTAYASMTEDLDEGLGMLLSAMSALGLDSNTYVIYTSDNGAATSESSNNPLRRGKLYIREGGVRVPFIIRGPNITAGSRSEVPIIGYDVYPTFVEWLAGTGNPIPSNVEGENLVSIMDNGGVGTLNRDKPIVFHAPNYETGQKVPTSAIVVDSMKFMVNYETGEFELFNLADDIRENDNIKDSFPDLTNTLCLQLRDYLKEVNAEMPLINDTTITPGSALPADVDGDGLDDLWEVTELLTFAYGANDNPDGDTLTNMEEFLGGTDPYVFDSVVVDSTVHTIEEMLDENKISVFPNPVRGVMLVQNLQANDRAVLFDGQGKRVMRLSAKSKEEDVSHLPAGIYFLSVTRKGELVHTEEIVIIN